MMGAINFVGCHPGNFRLGRKGFRPEAIVIHIMVGTMTSTRNWFANPVSGVSAHYGVGKDGSIEQYVQETDTAFHAGTVVAPTWPLLKSKINPNYYTIGIEHEGIGDSIWPDAQMKASRALADDIAIRWNIPLDDQHVVLHREIRHSKTCPGKFDRAAYLALSAAPKLVEAAALRNIETTSRSNIRIAPTRASAAARQVASGTTLAVTRTVAGEIVRGNNRWYQLAANEFIWAGATDRPNG